MTGQYMLRRGASPLILSIPHAGCQLIPGLAGRLSEAGRSLIDTDWWLEQLYSFAAEAFDASILSARLSRYVIDLNRDPSGVSLYPGQATTGLVPTSTFDGEAVYRPGLELGAEEIAERRRAYFDPYHEALEAEIARVRAKCGYALLYDCHSIRSVIPRLFSGVLPDFNLGTNSGASCAKSIEVAMSDALDKSAGSEFTHVVNGRFKGGWITRHYGRPSENVHAVQMELACRAYMDETPPFAFDEHKAATVRPVLIRVLDALLAAGGA